MILHWWRCVQIPSVIVWWRAGCENSVTWCLCPLWDAGLLFKSAGKTLTKRRWGVLLFDPPPPTVPQESSCKRRCFFFVLFCFSVSARQQMFLWIFDMACVSYCFFVCVFCLLTLGWGLGKQKQWQQQQPKSDSASLVCLVNSSLPPSRDVRRVQNVACNLRLPRMGQFASCPLSWPVVCPVWLSVKK